MDLPFNFQNDNPLFVIQNLRDELQKNIDKDDVIKITESCFSLAHYMELFRTQSPLEELRKGNLENAVALIALNDETKQYAWKLLLIWELKDQGKLDRAGEILKPLADEILKECDYCLTASLITYLLSMCTGIKDEIIFSTVEESLKKEEKIQFFKYLLSVKSSDGNLIANAVLQSVDNRERVNALKLFLLLAQHEICKNSQANSFPADTYLAEPETLQQIDSALKIADEYEKALTLSKIVPPEYYSSEEFLSDARYGCDGYLMTYLLPEQAIAMAEAGEIDAALNIYNLLNKHGWLHYNYNVVIAIANLQVKNGDSRAARTTIGLAIKEDRVSSYFDRIGHFGQYKRYKSVDNPTAELLEAILSIPYMCDRLIENNDMWDFFINVYLFLEYQQVEKDFKALLDYILHEAKQIPDRRRRIYIMGKAAVVQAKLGDVDNALNNLSYLMQRIEEIPGDKNKTATLLQVAKGYSFARQTDEALNAINKATKLTQREKKEWHRDSEFKDIAGALIDMGLYEMAIDILKNISNKNDQELVLETIAIDRIEKSDNGISIAEELMRQISDQGYRDQVIAKMAMHHVKKGEIENAQKLINSMNVKNKYLAVKAHNQILLDQYVAGDESAAEKLVINDNFMCHDDIEALAIAEMRAGLGELALQTAKLYLDDDFLFDLADTCVRVGDKETFNKIIPLALKDIPSACKIAGLLCRKYPDRARDIFKESMHH